MSSLMDRLKALGVSIGTSDIETPASSRKPGEDLAAILGGETIETIYGPVIRIINTYPAGFKHGDLSCIEPQTHEIFKRWGNLPDGELPGRFLFLDTETSGLSSGTGTFAFLVGMGYFANHEFRLFQYFLESPANESAMLAALIQDAAGTDTFVTYNGKSFDIPLLRSRFILNRMENILDDYFHADLLHITRKIYKFFLPERNLGVVEKEILHFTRDEIEVPGWMVPEIYAEFLQNHDPEPIKRVLYHNQIDILSLAALYQHINALLQSITDNCNQEIPPAVLLAMVRLYIEHNDLETATALFSAYQESETEHLEYAKTAYLLGMAHKQVQMIDKAIMYWEIASENGDIPALVELAKHYEHQLGAYKQALAYTKKAITIQGKTKSEAKNLQLELEKRKDRLERLLIESAQADS